MARTSNGPGSMSRTDAAAPTGIQTWDNEGGARSVAPDVSAVPLIGSASQVEWAERIRIRANAEFDRVAAAFRAVAQTQSIGRAGDTAAILQILEEKRAEVMKNEKAGYFIHDWQEINDQVRQMIFNDPRYPAIRTRMAARRD